MRKVSSLTAGFSILLTILLLMGGCGGGNGGTNTPAPTACSTATAPTLPALAAPNGTVGSAYSFTSGTITGGIPPYSISTTGSLPPGLTAAGNAAGNAVTIAGTPTQAGSFTGTVQVTDSCTRSASGQVTITVNAPLLVVPGITPPNATINQPYVFNSLAITGGTPPFVASIGAGALPAGLNLSIGAGNVITISGTPTVLGGPTTFTVTVRDSGNPQQVVTTAQASITVVNLVVSTQFLPDATNAVNGYTATLANAGGVAPFTWTITAGALPAGMTLATNGTITGTPTVTGKATFTAQIKDANNATATANLVLNVLPELPRVFLDTTMPASVAGVSQPGVFFGGTQAVPNTTAIPQIQAILNGNTACGTVIKLHAGDYFAGKLVFPRHVPECTAATAIIITTDDATLPAPGTRVTPADAAHMPKILTNQINNAALDFTATATSAAACTAAPASCGGSFYRIVGVEVSATGAAINTPGVTFDSALVNVGNDESTVAMMPHDITLDRCYIHGIANTGEIRRGVAFQGVNVAMIDSNVSEIHQTGFDSQAIAGWNGPGPFKIVNNRLEASTEDVVFGGAIGSNNGGDTVIADLEIRNNYFTKQLSWQTTGNTNTGTLWLEKNLLEFKNGNRILIDGNAFENVWSSAQVGYAILLTPRGPASHQAGPSDSVSEVTIQHNLIAHAGGGVNVAASDFGVETPGVLRGKNVVIQNNVFLDINQNPLSQAPFGAGINANAAVVQLLDGVPNVTIQHNTGFSTGPSSTAIIAGISATSSSNRQNAPSVIQNNLFQNAAFGVFCGTFGFGNVALSSCFDDPATPGPDWTFQKNILLQLQNGALPANYPATNQVCDAANDTCFPPDQTSAGITDPANCNAGAFDFHACALVRYNNAGTDGKDLGADTTQIITTPFANPVKP